MAILLLFAFLAGLVTILSPCILPVLPALLAAGSGKGYLRPLGVIIGMILSFTFFTLTLATIVQYLGVSALYLRYAAMIIIALFGIIMIFPQLSDWFSRKTNSLAELGERIHSASNKTNSGFLSGLILGLALGLIWTPCAGPILAAITTLAATHQVSLLTVLITLFYSIGAAIPMFFIAYGGNWIINSSKSLSKYSEGIRRCFGVLMILTALAIAFNYDIYYELLVAEYFPAIPIENNNTVRSELSKLRQQTASNANLKGPQLFQSYPQAPEFAGIAAWLNSPPLKMDDLKGKVVLVDFWTYSCINCVRTLPYITSWYDKYNKDGFVVVGVHTPEFEFEKNKANVEDAIKRYHIKYPVALDNDFQTWNAYNNSYWPADYLIDQSGKIRLVHFGEGAYMETEDAIRNLLGLAPLQGKEKTLSHRPITPEIYLGYRRAHHYSFALELAWDHTYDYQETGILGEDRVSIGGKWFVGPEFIKSEGSNSTIKLDFTANRVYAVLGGQSDQPIKVLLDGAPLPAKFYTADMNDKGEIFVKEARMYAMVNLHKDYGRHVLQLQVPAGIEMYTFTFGDEE